MQFTLQESEAKAEVSFQAVDPAAIAFAVLSPRSIAAMESKAPILNQADELRVARRSVA